MLKFLSSKTNESSKRLIAFLFALTLIAIAIFCNSEKILSQLVYVFTTLIVLLLGLTTVEKLAELWKNKN